MFGSRLLVGENEGALSSEEASSSAASQVQTTKMKNQGRGEETFEGYNNDD